MDSGKQLMPTGVIQCFNKDVHDCRPHHSFFNNNQNKSSLKASRICGLRQWALILCGKFTFVRVCFPAPPMIACIPSRRLSTSSIATAATSSLKRGHQLCNGLSAASRSGHGRVMVASRVGSWSETSGRVGSCVKLKEPSFN